MFSIINRRLDFWVNNRHDVVHEFYMFRNILHFGMFTVSHIPGIMI